MQGKCILTAYWFVYVALTTIAYMGCNLVYLKHSIHANLITSLYTPLLSNDKANIEVHVLHTM